MDATNLLSLADYALAGVKPSQIIVAALNVGRNQIIEAFATALAEAVVDGCITDDCAEAINERAIAVFAAR